MRTRNESADGPLEVFNRAEGMADAGSRAGVMASESEEAPRDEGETRKRRDYGCSDPRGGPSAAMFSTPPERRDPSRARLLPHER
ncbi:Hypothetical protein NTJ_08770 [Nesidiocoris tenuis]|uniref:Uncharacterized protein n=1 Tax=Nesidiocoris tenuis TaxID=355587 RepID=A0ABN7AUV1_9HEMI|nr:Hypothetical protein NTJ_08770 [Nesidiocoris tenuis]